MQIQATADILPCKAVRARGLDVTHRLCACIQDRGN